MSFTDWLKLDLACLCVFSMFVTIFIVIPVIVNSGRIAEEERKKEIDDTVN